MRRWAPIAFLLSTLVAAAPARAQGLIGIFVGGPGVQRLSQTTIPATISGQLEVSFHGDTASGCGLYGLCAYSGAVTVKPSPSGSVGIVKYRQHHRIGYLGTLYLGDPGDETTAARVQRADAGGQLGRCVDAQSGFVSADLTAQHGELTVSVLQNGGSLLSTRCAAPLDGDVRPAGPRVTMSVSTVLRGQTLIDLRAIRTFASHGFAGTVTSTITVRLGRPSTDTGNGGGSGPNPPGIKLQRQRYVTARLELVSSRGNVRIPLRGAADPDVCVLLDSCGFSGTLLLRPVPRPIDAQLTAIGPATRPYSDFLAALGLRRRGRTAGITVGGGIDWHDHGVLEASLAGCTDTGSLEEGSVGFASAGASINVAYQPGSPLRTRCPGPMLSSDTTVLSGSLPRAALRRRVFTVRLAGGSPFTDDGYAGQVEGTLSMTLRRGPVSSQFIEVPSQ